MGIDNYWHGRGHCTSTRCGAQRGQATVALAGVLTLACLIILAVVIVGQAMVHRAEARAGADAIALASSVDPAAAEELSEWYRAKGMIVDYDGGYARVGSGPSQASAWAATTEASGPAPVIVAIVGRAEQIVGVDFTVAYGDGLLLRIPPDQATALRTVAASFSLCEIASLETQDWVTFSLC